ncbi:hypothetical protein V6N13_140262 [Hibiscus sabdariffa]|uniref:Uncharacterized protein n=1 Tax=Hibiscus sabdariffa TaxID=183260 RepID=A0ABR2QAM4_9ROSI
MEMAEPGKRQCMGGETTESCWLEPSMLSLFPAFCLPFQSFSLSGIHHLVSVEAQTKPDTLAHLTSGLRANVPILVFLRNS